MGDLIYRLLLFINSSTEENLNFTIAEIMLDNVKDIPNMSINKLAAICYTSPAAISRFCRKLGYSNFAQFKKNADFSLKARDYLLDKPKDNVINVEREALFNNLFLEVDNYLAASKNTFDLKIIDRVLELMYSSKDIVIFGTQYSQLMGQDLQFKFASLGKLLRVASDVQQQENLADSLNSDSLAILISPSGRFTIYHEILWNKISSSNCNLIVITYGDNELYKERANYIIHFNNDELDCYSSSYRYTLPLLIDYIYNRFISLYHS